MHLEKKNRFSKRSLFFKIGVMFSISTIVFIIFLTIFGMTIYKDERHTLLPRYVDKIIYHLVKELGNPSDTEKVKEFSKEYKDLDIIIYLKDKIIFNNHKLDDIKIEGFFDSALEIAKNIKLKGYKARNYFITYKNDYKIIFVIRFRKIQSLIFKSIIAIGTVTLIIFIILLYFIHKLLDPINILINATNEIAKGNYNLKLNPDVSKEFETLFDSFNEMSEKLNTIFSNNLLLIGNISHDLKYYITRLKLSVEVEIEDEEIKESFNEDLNNMTEYIDKSMQVFKFGSKEKILDIKVENISEAIIKKFGKIDDIKLDIDENLHSNIDILYFNNVLDNLYNNAKKYGEDVKINLKRYGDRFAINVINKTDYDIDDDELKLLFQPFYRFDKSREQKKRGSGLGLFIVKEILQSFGFRIEISIVKQKYFVVKISGDISEFENVDAT